MTTSSYRLGGGAGGSASPRSTFSKVARGEELGSMAYSISRASPRTRSPVAVASNAERWYTPNSPHLARSSSRSRPAPSPREQAPVATWTPRPTTSSIATSRDEIARAHEKRLQSLLHQPEYPPPNWRSSLYTPPPARPEDNTATASHLPDTMESLRADLYETQAKVDALLFMYETDKREWALRFLKSEQLSAQLQGMLIEMRGREMARENARRAQEQAAADTVSAGAGEDGGEEGGEADAVTGLFQALDANDDGVLTREEFVETLAEGLGGAAEPAHQVEAEAQPEVAALEMELEGAAVAREVADEAVRQAEEREQAALDEAELQLAAAAEAKDEALAALTQAEGALDAQQEALDAAQREEEEALREAAAELGAIDTGADAAQPNAGAGAVDGLGPLELARAAQKFASLDADQSETLCGEELVQLASWVFGRFHPAGKKGEANAAQLDKMARKILGRHDSDGDGSMDFGEFAVWYTKTCADLKRFQHK